MSNDVPQSITFDGAFSTYKTTTFDYFKQNHGADPRFYLIEDQGRKMLQDLGFDANNMTPEQVEEGQLYVIEGYIREEDKARSMGKIAVSDGSLIEGLAYAKGIFSDRIYAVYNNILKSRATRYTSMYFPVLQKDIENDGLRHTNIEYQHHIDSVILSILREHKIRTLTIATPDRDVRAAIVTMDILAAAELFR